VRFTSLSSLRARARSVPAVRRVVVDARHVGTRSADAFLVSYPKSGSTWLRFMLAEALSGDEVDFETVERIVPRVGAHRVPGFLSNDGRLIASHEPYRRTFGRPCSRAVYVARDIRSVAVSYYWFQVRRGGFSGELSSFVDALIEGRVDGYGSWADHVNGWLGAGQTGRCNLHIVRYEDLLLNPATELAKALEFLGCSIGPDRLESVIESNTRSKMSAKEAMSPVLTRRRKADIPFVRTSDSDGPRSPLPDFDAAKLVASSGSALTRLGYSG
jgi:hypothetical protein